MGRLVLKLKKHESFMIGVSRITIADKKGSEIKIMIEAPDHIKVIRLEHEIKKGHEDKPHNP